VNSDKNGYFIGVSGVDFALQENDTIFQEQITERHLPLTLVALIGLRIQNGWQGIESVQGIVPSLFGDVILTKASGE
jgi:hypothetical protein